MKASLLATLALGQLTLAQFVTPPSNLVSKKGYANVTVRYKEVPAGVCEQRPDVRSYSGYADVEENQHIFWWFFEARNIDPTTAPLTVWINGGPGSSSMIGLFQELGPCTVNASGVAVDNPYSWSNVSNMLFIDQPTQTGFSYSVPVPGYTDPTTGNIIVLPNNTCPDYATDWACGTYSLPDTTLTANSTPGGAPNMYRTLQGFMGAFPQYSRKDFFFTTESYGGHYGPIYNAYFLQQNARNISGTIPINLKGVMIGNGWFDPLTGYEAYYNYSVSPGNPYDVDIYNSSWKALLTNSLYGKGNCIDQINECVRTGRDDVCSTADSYCAKQIEYPYDNVSGRDEYDIRYLTPSPFPPNFYVDYLNEPDVLAAIGAYVNFTDGNPTVGNAFAATGDDARAFDIPKVIGQLVEQNITVILYFGDADYNCNYLGGLTLLNQITPTPASFSSAGFTPILSNSSTTTSPRGEIRQASNFAFARIYQSGHEVPFYQPELALTIFTRFIAGRDLATGKGSAWGTVTNGSLTTTYREGNRTVTSEVLPVEAVYDWVTELPVLPKNGTAMRARRMRRAEVEEAVVVVNGDAVQKRFRREVVRQRPSRLGLHHRAQGGRRGRVV